MKLLTRMDGASSSVLLFVQLILQSFNVFKTAAAVAAASIVSHTQIR